MYNRSALSVVAIALVATGCTIAAPDAPTALRPPSPRLSEASGGGDLAVSIQGNRKYKKETLATFRVEVSGGVPPYSYYWSEEVCWYPDAVTPDGFTTETCNAYLISQPSDKNPIQHLIRSDFKTVRLQVQVRDSQGAYITGTDAVDIFAPGFYAAGSGGGGMGCGAKSYAFVETTPGAHFGEQYDRSPCGGTKIYKPQYPNGPV